MTRSKALLARAAQVISTQNELIARLYDLLACYETGQLPPAALTDRITTLRRQLTSL